MGFAIGTFSKYSNSVMLGIETIERMSTRARIRKKKKKKWHNRIIPHNIYIHMCKTEQWNKWAGSRVKSHRQRETEKEEEEDSSQPKTCAHLIVTSISSKQTYREVSAVSVSKNPAGSAWRELSITLCVGFKCNIHTYIGCRWPGRLDVQVPMQWNPASLSSLLFFFSRNRLKVHRARLQL